MSEIRKLLEQLGKDWSCAFHSDMAGFVIDKNLKVRATFLSKAGAIKQLKRLINEIDNQTKIG